jgi:hypothetical protein
VLAGVGGQPELGKEHEGRLTGHRLAHEGNGLADVEVGIGDPDGRNGHRRPHEVVIVEVEELLTCLHRPKVPLAIRRRSLIL